MLETSIDLNKMVKIGDFISKQLDRINQSKTVMAMLAKTSRQKFKPRDILI